MQLFPLGAAPSPLGAELGVAFEDVRIDFTFERTNSSAANTGRVELYNLNDQTIAEATRSGVKLVVEAGYTTTPLFELFRGDVRDSVVDPKADGDTVLRFEIEDGGEALTTPVVAQFPVGTPVADVLRSVAESVGLVPGTLLGDLTARLTRGLTVAGLAEDVLKDLAGQLGGEVTVQDEQVFVLPKGVPNSDEMIVLSPDTGLIGVPVKTEEGIRVQALLVPIVRPGGQFRVESSRLTGNFVAQRVVQAGSNYTNNFYQTIEGVQV